MSNPLLSELVTRIRRPIPIDPIKEYAEIGVRSHGKGIFHKKPVTGSDLGSKKVYAIEPGDLVFNIVFAWEGAVAVAGEGERGRCGSHRFPTYRPIPGICLAEYLNLFFQTQVGRDLLLLSSPGSAGRNRTLNQEMLLGCRVPAPCIADQRRIVDLIEAVDGVALAAEGEALAAIQFAASHETDFCSLAENAEHTTLEAIADVVGGITKDKKKEEAGTGFVEVPYLRVANVQRGFLDLSTLTSIKVSAVAAERLRLQHGDVLMNEGGDRDKLGRGWIWEGQVADCVHQNHVFRARINDEGFEPRFVSLWANTYGQRWFFENGGQTTGIASISLSTLKRFPVPRLPLSRQAEIVAMSEAARQAGDRARSVAETARGLRAVLLSELLSGKHQIPWSYDALLVPA